MEDELRTRRSEAGRYSKLFFVDVGSTNGTTIHEGKVEPKTEIWMGDGLELKVGKSTMKFIVQVQPQLSSSARNTNFERKLQGFNFAEGTVKDPSFYPSVPQSEILGPPSLIMWKSDEGRKEDDYVSLSMSEMMRVHPSAIRCLITLPLLLRTKAKM